MADEATGTPAQDQSQQSGAPTQDQRQETTSPEFFSDQFDANTLDEPLQQRYRQMQADYTRKTQELSEQRKQAESVNALINDLQSEDPQTRANAVNWLAGNGLLSEQDIASVFGYQFEDDTTGEDPNAALMARLDALEGKLTSTEQQAATEQYVAAVDQHLQSQIGQINAQREAQGRSPLSDSQARVIVKNALVDTDPGQYPDVNAAYQDFAAVMDEGITSWSATKRGGATTGGGAAATQVPDLDTMTRTERQQWMAQRLQELEGQAGP